MAANLLTQWGTQIQALTLVPSGGGVFEVEVDGVLVYSKQSTGRHAEDGEVEKLFESQVRGKR